MKLLTYNQATQLFDAVKTYSDKTYTKSSEITATIIPSISDGSIEMPWFEITSGVITNCGTKSVLSIATEDEVLEAMTSSN